MPTKSLPTPNSGQSREDFISACMVNPTMKSDFPEEAQRIEVCNSQWSKGPKSKAEDENGRSNEFEVKHLILPFQIEEVKRLIMEPEEEEGKPIEQIEDDDHMKIVFKGYAAAFGNIDLGGDVIEKGAFELTLRRNNGRVPIQIDHGRGIMQNAGFGLEALEDEIGLRVRGRLNLNKAAAREALATMQDALELGIQLGLSIGYRTRDFEDDPVTGIRTLKELDLVEYSVTLFPMNTSAMVTSLESAVKSNDERQLNLKKFQIRHVLRSHGCEESGADEVIQTLLPTAEQKQAKEEAAKAQEQQSEDEATFLSMFKDIRSKSEDPEEDRKLFIEALQSLGRKD